MEPVGDVEQARASRAAGDLDGARKLLKERVRTHRNDDAARLELVRLYREAGAPDQAGRWGITLPGVVTDLERDRLARMLAGARWWGGEPSEILALPKGRQPDAVTELLSGPVEQHWQRMRDRRPDLVPPSDPDPLVDAVAGSWILGFVTPVLGLLGLWVITAFELMDPVLFARTLAALVAYLLSAALLLTGSVVARDKPWRSALWFLAGIVVLGVAIAITTAVFAPLAPVG